MVADDSQHYGPRKDECAVTKSQLLHFFEVKFAMADRDHDGQLSVTELANFLRSVAHPDLRSLRSWDRFS
jgi:Ca2+-binding EF-hand superfamily protein